MKKALLLLCLVCSFQAFAQKKPNPSAPLGIVFFNNPDSVRIYNDLLMKNDVYLSYENLTQVPEFHWSPNFFRQGMWCIQRHKGRYTVMANPYYFLDINTGEASMTDSIGKFYIKEDKQVTFVPIQDFVSHAFIYGFQGKIYTDSLGKTESNCNMTGCLVPVRIFGNFLMVTPPQNHDCRQFAPEPCLKEMWIQWRDDKEILIKYQPY